MNKKNLNKLFGEMTSSAAGLPGIEGLHGAKKKKKVLKDEYIDKIQEGKVWDKVKKVWRDHSGKILSSTAAVAAAGAALAYKNKDSNPGSIAKNVKKHHDDQKKKTTEKKWDYRKGMVKKVLKNSPVAPLVKSGEDIVKQSKSTKNKVLDWNRSMMPKNLWKKYMSKQKEK